MLEEVLESPAFWILGAGGTIAIILGWIMSKKAGWEVLPTWQIIVMIIATIAASAYFSVKD